MKITLEFEDYDEAEHRIKGIDYYCALWDFHQWMRSQMKHGELTEAKWVIYEEIQNKFFSILDENKVNLD